jgi:hypothetical protein
MGVVSQILLEYKDVFNDKVKPFEEYLDPLSRDQLMMVGVFFFRF